MFEHFVRDTISNEIEFGSTVNIPSEVAGAFNRYFSEIGPSLANDVRNENENISRIRRCDNLRLSLHFKPSLQSAFYTDRMCWSLAIVNSMDKIINIFGQRLGRRSFFF